VSELDNAQLGAELRAAIARVYRRFRSERGDGELGDAAVAVLNRLHTRGPLTLTELSGYEQVTAGSMSQTVNRLADGGYITRRRDDHDKRRVLIEPTPDGHTVAAAARAHRENWMNTRLATFTAGERETLARAAALLRRLADDS
jgi:DNA-binding MarR family transcriptional regulator